MVKMFEKEQQILKQNKRLMVIWSFISRMFALSKLNTYIVEFFMANVHACSAVSAKMRIIFGEDRWIKVCIPN